MIISKSYSLSLLASISTTLSLKNARLVGITDVTGGAGVMEVIEEHNNSLFRLPDVLKTIDIYSELFYHFKIVGTSRIVIIPLSYINQASVKLLASVSKTYIFELDTDIRHAELLRLLDDNGFNYRQA